MITNRLSYFKQDEKGAQALWGRGGGRDTLTLQLRAAAGKRQGRGKAWGSGHGRWGWWADLCPLGVRIRLLRGAQHAAGLEAEPSWTPSRHVGWSGQDISHCRVKHFDNGPAETQQRQVVLTAAAPVCWVSRYFANPVVFGLKRKEGSQKTKPWACLKCRDFSQMLSMKWPGPNDGSTNTLLLVQGLCVPPSLPHRPRRDPGHVPPSLSHGPRRDPIPELPTRSMGKPGAARAARMLGLLLALSGPWGRLVSSQGCSGSFS